MKKLELANLHVQELSLDEMKQTDGGIWGDLIRAGIAIYNVYNKFCNYDGRRCEMKSDGLQDNTRVVAN